MALGLIIVSLHALSSIVSHEARQCRGTKGHDLCRPDMHAESRGRNSYLQCISGWTVTVDHTDARQYPRGPALNCRPLQCPEEPPSRLGLAGSRPFQPPAQGDFCSLGLQFPHPPRTEPGEALLGGTEASRRSVRRARTAVVATSTVNSHPLTPGGATGPRAAPDWHRWQGIATD